MSKLLLPVSGADVDEAAAAADIYGSRAVHEWDQVEDGIGCWSLKEKSGRVQTRTTDCTPEAEAVSAPGNASLRIPHALLCAALQSSVRDVVMVKEL